MTARKAPKPRAKAAAGPVLPDIRAIATAEISVDQRAQSRAALDTEAVADYAQAMRDGVQFPPLVVFHDGEAHWLAEGFHRFAAAREAGLDAIACEIRPGSLRDAILHSAGANATHGLRRSNADKRRAILILLEDEEWRGWNDSEIARRCVVDHKTVARLRAEHLGNSQDAPRTVSRGGNVYTMDTAAIGRRPADTPAPPAEPSPPAEEPASEGRVEPTNVVALAPRLPELPTPEVTERTGDIEVRCERSWRPGVPLRNKFHEGYTHLS